MSTHDREADEIAVQIGRRLREARRRRNLSVRALARAAGEGETKSLTKFYDAERGRRKASAALLETYADVCQDPSLKHLSTLPSVVPKSNATLDDLLFNPGILDDEELDAAFVGAADRGDLVLADSRNALVGTIGESEEILDVASALLRAASEVQPKTHGHVLLTALGEHTSLSANSRSRLLPHAIRTVLKAGRSVRHVISGSVYERMSKSLTLSRFISLLHAVGDYDIRQARQDKALRTTDFLIVPEMGALILVPGDYRTAVASTAIFIRSDERGSSKHDPVKLLEDYVYQLWSEGHAFFDIVDPSSSLAEGERRGRVTRTHERIEGRPGERVLIKDGVSDIHFPLDAYLDYESHRLEDEGFGTSVLPSWVDDALFDRRNRYATFMRSLRSDAHHEICTMEALELFARRGRFNNIGDEFGGKEIASNWRRDQLNSLILLLNTQVNYHFWPVPTKLMDPDRWVGSSLLLKNPKLSSGLSEKSAEFEPSWWMVYESRRLDRDRQEQLSVAFVTSEPEFENVIRPAAAALLLEAQKYFDADKDLNAARRKVAAYLTDLVSRIPEDERQAEG